MWNLWCTFSGWFVLAQVALVLLFLIAWPIGEASEARIRRRRDKAVAEVERLRKKASGRQ